MFSTDHLDGRRSRLRASLPFILVLAWAGLGMSQEAPSADRLPPVLEPVEGALPKEGSASTPGQSPDEKAGDGGPEKCDGAKKDKEKDDQKKKPFWTTVPHIRPPPPLGNFVVFLLFPTGPGYYSLWDMLQGNYRSEAPKRPWPPISPDTYSFFNADFRYLDDPKNKQHDWLDCLKRIHPNDCWLLSFGGEERFQYKDETANGERLNGKDNMYQLNRVRLYGDVWYRDNFRLYAEYIDAQAMNEQLRPLPIDIWKNGILNLFTDVKLYTYNNNPIYFRGGRQEMLYGSQRTISPLDWANTRRTFQGYKVFYRSEKFDLDGWWLQPVIAEPNGPGTPNSHLQFPGVWTTYRPRKGVWFNAAYLFLEQTNGNTMPLNALGAYHVNCLNMRYAGREKKFLWDFEGWYEFGGINRNTLSANAGSAGLGWDFSDLRMTPAFWVYAHHASGDQNGGQGGTFNQLFPFGHYYFGFIDAVGRQNVNEINNQLYFFPTKWITAGLQGHYMYLDSGKDFLYNAAGNPIRRSLRGNAGVHIGDEVDWIINFHLSFHQDILVGFSQLFAGEFIRKTGSPRSPEFFYLQYSYKW